MAINSVKGRFRDIEILFSIDGDATIMSVRNLVNSKRHVRVMYQKLSISGLANWAQFQLTDTPISHRLPREILQAYRLTFFVDDADPVSARIEKILTELEALKSEKPADETSGALTESDPLKSGSLTENHDAVHTPRLGSPEDLASVPTTPPNHAAEPAVPAVDATQKLEEVVADTPITKTPAPIEANIDETQQPLDPIATRQQLNEKVEAPEPLSRHTPESLLPRNEQKPKSRHAPPPMALKLPVTREAMSVSSIVDSHLEFKIAVPSLPRSARAARQKAQASAHLTAKAGSTKRKEKGMFGRFIQAVGLAPGGRRGKAYYQKKGEEVQNTFQDQLAKLERDYNEGYGLNLLEWDMDALSESEIAILLLNLMVNEVTAWQKETKRATSKTEQLAQTLDEVDTSLRRTLKQTRGVATPSPTLFPDLLAENERDLEKIQNECDAYLQRFTGKLIQQEKKHAEKIEVLIFKKFLLEFIQDFLFVEIAERTQGDALPERLHWFLDLVESEVIPIEVGETKVSRKHHRVKGNRSCEFSAGTIIEVVTAGLQSKDGERVSQKALVIAAG